MILLFNRDDTVLGQNLVRLGNGEDSANNQIYLLDSAGSPTTAVFDVGL